MNRIKIDKALINDVKAFNAQLFNNKTQQFCSPKIGLKKLYYTLACQKQRRYIAKLYKEYDCILSLKPSEFKSKILEFKAIYLIDGIKKSDSTIFGKKVVEALRYDSYRDSQYPKFIHELGWNLKACFYCNYAGTLNVKRSKEYKTYYDLDHILPKSTYPFLATSFFNFIPVCATCNRNKSSQEIEDLNPFYEEGETNFELQKIFEVSSKAKVEFYTSNDREKITISIADKINNVDKVNYNKIVDLESLYSTQKYIAEEILWKKRIYSKSHILNIKSSFQKLKLNDKEINRILWGTDLDERTINDIPLSKLKLDLIKDELSK